MILHLVAVIALGLMCGSELNVAAFGHPILNRQPLDTHIRVRSSMAALFGRVMPFWMGGSAVLNLWLVLPAAHLTKTAWRLAVVSAAIQMAAVIFSLVAPVPINNRIIRWTPETLPRDWQAQERRWDLYHSVRTAGLIAAFVILVFSFRIN